jgi:tetratricopeptide (TPR) repeat protein
MTEENNTQVEEPQSADVIEPEGGDTGAQPVEPNVVQVRKGELEGYKTQLKQLKEFEDKYNSLLKQQADADELKKQKELESQGKYEEALEAYKQKLESANAEKESLRQAHQNELRKMAFETELVKQGVTNKRFIKSVTGEYLEQEGDAETFLAALKAEEDCQAFFSAGGARPVQRPGDFAASGAPSKSDIQEIAAGMQSLNSAERVKAREKYRTLSKEKQDKVLQLCNQ